MRSERSEGEILRLKAQLNAAADDMQRLAHDITAAIDTLPWITSRGSRELFEQAARRALAISAALRVEANDPNQQIGGLLLNAGRAAAALLLVAMAHLSIGGIEEAGSDVWTSLRERAAAILGRDRGSDQSDRPREMLTEFGATLQGIRSARELSEADAAGPSLHASRILEWERGLRLPTNQELNLLDRSVLGSYNVDALKIAAMNDRDRLGAEDE